MKKNTVTQEQIDKIIKLSEFDVKTIFDKVTVVTAKLPNGFTIVESSACVDPMNYDESIGKKICMKRIENTLWQLEGYLLQEKLFKNEATKISNMTVNVNVEGEKLQETLKQLIDEKINEIFPMDFPTELKY